MATAVNPVEVAGISVGSALGAVTEALRGITVRVSAEHTGFGSGVIWRPDGLIVTNAHVARAPRQRIELADGRVFAGRVVARDARRDLAAIVIGARGLPARSIRDARTLRVGEIVLAVGNPFGEAGAVSVGIVHRSPGSHDWVVADVRLAPGNSGGPLADAQGNLVGINSMIVDGFGWAVPSNAVARLLREVSAVEVA
jgi:serine protease Do